MGSASMQIKIDEEMISPIVEAEIRTAIVKALGNTDDIIAKIVSSVLSAKVDQRGELPRYSSDARYTYLEWLCRNAIRDAAQQAIKEIIEERNDDLYAEVKRQMENSKGEWVQAMLTGLSRAVENTWSFKVNVELNNND